jgi:protein O-GlcNAc transferase
MTRVCSQSSRVPAPRAGPTDPERSRTLAEQGWRAFLAGDLGRARAACEAAVQADPGNASALRNLGCVLDASGHHQDAVLLYQRALGLRPDDAIVLSNLGVAYLNQQCPELARAAFERAVAGDATYPTAHLNLAQWHHQHGQAADAEEAYHQYLRLRPTDVHALYNLGVLQLGRGLHRQAAEAFGRVLRHEPDHLDAQLNLGIVLLGQNQVREAIRLFQNVLARAPTSALARYHLAVAHLADRDLPATAAALERLLMDNPAASGAASNLALVYREMGRSEEAAALLERALGRDPGNSLLHFNLGVIRQSQGRLPEARSCLEQVLRLEAPGAARHQRARALLDAFDGQNIGPNSGRGAGRLGGRSPGQ